MIKKQTTCMFMDKCSGCTAQTKCISATSVTTDLRKYLLKIQGHRQKPTLAMLDGKKRHEDNLKQYQTLAQMGWGKFQKKLYKGEKIVLQELSLCVIPSSTIEVYGGIKPISEVQVGDKVLTSQGKFMPVLEVFRREYDGPIYKVYSTGNKDPLVCTPEHPLLAVKTNPCIYNYKDNRFKICKPNCSGIKYSSCKVKAIMEEAWCTPDQLKKNDYLIYPTSQGNDSVTTVHTHDFTQRQKSFISAREELLSTGTKDKPRNSVGKYIQKENSLRTISKKYGVRHQALQALIDKRWDVEFINIPEDINITPEMMEVVGLFIAEGNFDNKNRSVSFCFSNQEGELVDKVNQFAMSFGLREGHIKPQIGAMSIQIHSKALVNIFSGCYTDKIIHKAYTKKIPTWAYNIPLQLIPPLIKGIWLGDGTVSKKEDYTVYSTSKTLIYQLRFFLARLGIFTSITHRKNNDIILGKKRNVRELYTLKTSGIYSALFKNKICGGGSSKKMWNFSSVYHSINKFLLPITRIEEGYYKGTVYNLSVQEDESYVSEGVVVHNCSPYMKLHGIVDKLEIEYTKDNKFTILVSDLKPFYSKKYLKQISCFLGETPIFTSRGLIPIKDCILGLDKVITHKGEYKRINDVIKIPYRGEAYKIYPWHSLPLIATPEHPFLVAKLNQKYKNGYCVWNKTKKRYDNRKFDSKEGKKGFFPLGWFKVNELNVKDLITIPKYKSKKEDTNIDKLILAGYYLAEGSLDFHYSYGKIAKYNIKRTKALLNRDNDTYYRISMSFGKKELSYVEEIQQCAERLKIKCKVYERHNIFVVELFSKDLTGYLEQFGKGAKNKHIPPWVLDLKQELQYILIDRLWRGDGHGDIKLRTECKIKNCSLTTISKTLAIQVWFMLLNMDISCSIYEHEAYMKRGFNGEWVDICESKLRKLDNPVFNVRINSMVGHLGKLIAFDKEYIYLPIRKLEKIQLDTEVYNLEVNEDNSYLAQGIAAHNCYGMILSQPDCKIAYEYITPRSHKLKRITKNLYPKKGDYRLSIDLEIDQYFANRKFRINWMVDNMMTDISMQLNLLNQASANKRRELHKRGIYYLDQLPPCKDCKQLDSYCSLYSICQKIVYNPEIKERQRYIGARELIVKTKPKVRA